MAILALASFFRLWQLEAIPPGLYPDVAINGNDALDSLATGQFKVFYPENNGREGLFFWLIALSFNLFGASVWSIKIVSALLGILTVLGLYLLTKELLNQSVILRPPAEGSQDSSLSAQNDKVKYIALLASFFLAISFWHVNFSRIGFRAIMTGFILCFSFYFLFRAFRRNNFFDYLWAGIFFGLGFYTYLAFRMAVLILAMVILWKMLVYWQENKPKKLTWQWLWQKTYLQGSWWKLDIFLAAIIIIALPIGLYFFNHPQDFLGRAAGVSIFSAEQPLKELVFSTIKTLGMFNFAGDWNWRHNFAGAPMLTWPVGILFILGVILTIKNLLISLIRGQDCTFQNPRVASGQGVAFGDERATRGSKKSSLGIFCVSEKYILTTMVSSFLLTWFIAMLLPAILTAEGLPHALRTIGVIPVVYIFAALGLFWLWEKLTKINKKFAFLILAVFLIHPAIADFNQYFFQWAENLNVPGAFRQDLVDLADYLLNLPPTIQKYLIVNEPGVAVPYPDGLAMPVQTIIFESRIRQQETAIKYLKTEQIDQIQNNHQPALVVLLKEDQNILQHLSEKWPNGKIIKINEFTAYEID